MGVVAATDSTVLSLAVRATIRSESYRALPASGPRMRFWTPLPIRVDAGDVDENDPGSVARFMKKMGSEMGEDFGDDFEEAMAEEMAESDTAE